MIKYYKDVLCALNEFIGTSTTVAGVEEFLRIPVHSASGTEVKLNVIGAEYYSAERYTFYQPHSGNYFCRTTNEVQVLLFNSEGEKIKHTKELNNLFMHFIYEGSVGVSRIALNSRCIVLNGVYQSIEDTSVQDVQEILFNLQIQNCNKLEIMCVQAYLELVQDGELKNLQYYTTELFPEYLLEEYVCAGGVL